MFSRLVAPDLTALLTPGSALLLLVGLLGAARPAAAQTPEAQTSGGPARPAVAPDRLDQAPAGARRASGKRYGAPTSGPASSPPRLAAPFVLTAVVVKGSTLPPGELDPAYRPFLGRTIEDASLRRISDGLAAIYARSDIALYTVLIADQRRENGVLEVQIVEGYIESAVVRGGVGAKAQGLIGRYLEPAAAERPLKKSTLQRAVSLVRDIPGLAAQINLEAGDRPGGVRAVIDGKQRRLQFAAGANNRGTALLGKTQGQVELHANSLLRGGDLARLTYAQPVGDAYYRAYGASYASPLGGGGLSISLSAGALTTRPRDIPIEGSAVNGAVQLSYPVVRSFDRGLVVSLGVDGVNSDNAFLGFTFSSERTRAVRLAASYSRQRETSATAVSATASQGLVGLGARLLYPELSQGDFRKLNLRIADQRTVRPSLVLRTSLSGQLSGDRLPGAEQMAAGGDEFGRAFETAIISGDTGLAASGELAWRPKDEHTPARLRGSELYVFADGAGLRRAARGAQPAIDSRLASTGGGARMMIGRKTVAQLEAVRGLNNPVAYEDREVWRLTFSIRSLAF